VDVGRNTPQKKPHLIIPMHSMAAGMRPKTALKGYKIRESSADLVDSQKPKRFINAKAQPIFKKRHITLLIIRNPTATAQNRQMTETDTKTGRQTVEVLFPSRRRATYSMQTAKYADCEGSMFR